jgi:hypothetical protein
MAIATIVCQTRITLNIELVCAACNCYGREINMETNNDNNEVLALTHRHDGAFRAEYKCPKCGTVIYVDFRLTNDGGM